MPHGGSATAWGDFNRGYGLAGGEKQVEIGGVMAAVEDTTKRIQIYPDVSNSAAREVTPFWKDKYERDARKYWDIFYRRHQDKFFKDRHYLDKEWGRYFHTDDGQRLVILEVGCGVGNTLFPLASSYPNFFIHACDFSERAISLVKAHKDFSEVKVNAFTCDLTKDDLVQNILPYSVDIVTMVFMLSAISPEKMHLVVQNIKKVLKPGGLVLFRDYATGDLAQQRLTLKDQKISEDFYVRGDGTRAFYFSIKFLTSLFVENGFHTEEVDIYSKQVENRSLELLMNRRWIQAVFSLQSSDRTRSMQPFLDPVDSDMGKSMIELFGTSSSADEVIEVKLRDSRFTIKTLGRDNQHTCKSTGLMMWESAKFMSTLLDENPSIVAGKTVLELGCGSAGICSMVAVRSAKFVVSTDGDPEALDLLRLNVMSNLETELHSKMAIKKLMWGDKDDINAVKDILNGHIDVIIGTDIIYNRNAVIPLFGTARDLISDEIGGNTKAALILCHIQRRASEEYIISTASQFGFTLVDKMTCGATTHGGILSSWFSDCFSQQLLLQKTPLNIMYFDV